MNKRISNLISFQDCLEDLQKEYKKEFYREFKLKTEAISKEIIECLSDELLSRVSLAVTKAVDTDLIKIQFTILEKDCVNCKGEK